MTKTPAPAAHPLRALALGLMGTTCLATNVQALARYECQLLQPVEGTSADSYPIAINRNGDVIGAFDDEPRAWDSTNKGRVLALEAGSGGYTMGSINDDGYAVGWARYASGPVPNFNVSYVWAPDGSYQRLSQDLGQATGVSGINNAGVVAGWTSTGLDPYVATLWDNGQQRTLKPLQSGRDAKAIQINDKGVVVGQSDRMADGALVTHAVRWRDGRVHDLGALPGHKFSTALALNTTGVIVGYSREEAKGGAELPVAWVNGVIQPLTSVSGVGLARSVNKHGEIVGYIGSSRIRAAYWPNASAEAVLIESLLDLGHVCRSPDGSRATLFMATAINAHGVIVAYGNSDDRPYPTYSFRLVPMTRP